jgi:hypothetical protein
MAVRLNSIQKEIRDRVRAHVAKELPANRRSKTNRIPLTEWLQSAPAGCKSPIEWVLAGGRLRFGSSLSGFSYRLAERIAKRAGGVTCFQFAVIYSHCIAQHGGRDSGLRGAAMASANCIDKCLHVDSDPLSGISRHVFEVEDLVGNVRTLPLSVGLDKSLGALILLSALGKELPNQKWMK